jgi:fucose 4-O-acetylase-like acetyltransferase
MRQTLTLKEPRKDPRRAPQRPQQRRSRDPHWDNMRYLAGTLVVFMHLADTLTDRDGLRWLHIATWAMRVPVFAIVAGYFSSAEPLTLRRAWRTAETLLVPYLALLVLHALQIRAMTGSGHSWSIEIPGPAWMMWFLLALLAWRAALPYLARLRHPLTLSVPVAVISGYVPFIGLNLNLARTLCFLPFFLLGWRLRQGLFARQMRAAWSRKAAVAVVAVTFAVSWFIRDNVDLEWLKMRGPYEEVWGSAVRCVILLGGMAVALSLMRLIPRRRLPFVTYLGSGGLYIYLLHPFVVRPFAADDTFAWVDTWTEQAGLLVLSVALATALASPPVRRLTRPIIQPTLLRDARRLRARLPAQRSREVAAG